jgi:glycosyltransferase involved in cell wall biosynthesis
MKVSFIVPVYRKKLEQFKECLKTLFSQSYKDIEVICVFDGPDEALETISNKFSVKNVVIEHGGANKARNEGLKHASGEIICWWDADCYAVPEMVKVWAEYFKKNPQADFLYSGYRWTDPNIPGYESESIFDPWLLTKYNYISTMCPIKREKAVEWDESLTGLQDWDFWRRVVANGAKGVYVPCGPNAAGAGWSSDFPDKQSISGDVQEDTFKNRVLAIRRKFNDPESDVLVYGGAFRYDAIRLAKLIDADYFWKPIYIVHNYKLCLFVGFNPSEYEQHMMFLMKTQKETKVAIYWMGIDAETLGTMPYLDVKKFVAAIKKDVAYNICTDFQTQNDLKELGIEAEIVNFPRPEGNIITTYPEKFKVLAFGDKENNDLIDSVIKALPDMDFEKVVPNKGYKFEQYSVLMQFTVDKTLQDGQRNALIGGRWMVSNIQAPFAGYVDTSDPAKAVNEIVTKLRELQDKTTFNAEAQSYYLDLTDPGKFKAKVKELTATPLEVVNA